MTSVLSCLVATIALAADPGLKGLPFGLPPAADDPVIPHVAPLQSIADPQHPPPSPPCGPPKILDHPGKTGHSDTPPCPPAPASISSPGDTFKYVQDRLDQFGATYYLLETSGNKKDVYCFYCRMSVGGKPGVTQPFWCYDSDPLKAMTMVLKQVEGWQSGREDGHVMQCFLPVVDLRAQSRDVARKELTGCSSIFEPEAANPTPFCLSNPFLSVLFLCFLSVLAALRLCVKTPVC